MMKKIFTYLIGISMTFSVFAQAPQKMSYQCVIRNANGVLIINQDVGIRISILQGTANGNVVYRETYNPNPQTNANGLVTIEIGGGTAVTGIFAEIDWSTGTYFIKTETDPLGGTSYSITGTSQLLSVPYALFALNANNISLTKDSRPSNLYVKDDGSLWVIPNISVESPYSLIPTVVDVDGNIYGTVKIGTQVWINENLKTTKYNDNTDIPLVTDNTEWVALITPAFCWYENDAITNKDVYGALYNWYTVNSNKLCPLGWHVPAKSEWETLKTYLGSLSAGRLKEIGTTHWREETKNAINDSKFTARPGGMRNYEGLYDGIGSFCIWWSSTDYVIIPKAYFTVISYGEDGVTTDQPNSYFIGSSVRCIKDN